LPKRSGTRRRKYKNVCVLENGKNSSGQMIPSAAGD
jgi:hypothetical protein